MPRRPKKPPSWETTPNHYRTNKMVTLTLTPDAIAALERLVDALVENRSAIVSRLLVEAARKL